MKVNNMKYEVDFTTYYKYKILNLYIYHTVIVVWEKSYAGHIRFVIYIYTYTYKKMLPSYYLKKLISRACFKIYCVFSIIIESLKLNNLLEISILLKF